MTLTKPSKIQHITKEVITNNLGYPEFESVEDMYKYFEDEEIIPTEKLILKVETRIEITELEVKSLK